MSRRSFLKLAAAAGLAITLPLGGGRYQHAYGDDYIIFVLNRWEVGICLYDVSTGSALQGVPGASVTITSLFNQKTATGTTNEHGIAILDVRDLAETDAAGDKRETWQFWASILAQKDGYRIYETGKQRIRTPYPVDAATEPLDGRPYARCITFDEYDIQYAKAPAFVRTKGNSIDHTLMVKIAGMNDPCNVGFKNSTGVSETRTAAPGNDYQTASFTGTYLLAGAANAFSADSQTLITFYKVSDPSTAATITTKLAIEDGVIDEATQSTDYSQKFNPLALNFGDAAIETPQLNAPSTSLGMIPKNIPFIGGLEASAVLPLMPIQFAFNPFGMALIGVGAAAFIVPTSMGSDKSTMDWARTSKDSFTNQWSQMTKEWDKKWDNFTSKGVPKAAVDPVRPSVGVPVPNLEMGFSAGAMLGLEWTHFNVQDQSLARWKGDLKLFVRGYLNFTVTEQLSVNGLPIPVFVIFDFSADLTATGLLQATSKTSNISSLFASFDNQLANSGLSFDLGITAGVSIGIGIAGLVSAAIRGYIYFKPTIGLVYPPMKADGTKRESFPHLALSVGSAIQLVAQFLLFKKSFEIASLTWPCIVSNWEKDKASTKATYNYPFKKKGFSLDATSGQNAAAEPVAVTQVHLGTTKELLATSNSSGGFDYAVPAPGSGGGISTGVLCNVGTSALHSSCRFGASTTEHLIYQNIFSDPRIRVINVNDTLFMFRIITCEYPPVAPQTEPQQRTRLSWTRFDAGVWSQPEAIEFELDQSQTKNPLGIKRIDTFDYDFDVVVAPKSDDPFMPHEAFVQILITSGTRNQGDATTLGETASQTILSFLSFSADMATLHRRHSFFDFYGQNPDGKDRMFLFPRLCYVLGDNYSTPNLTIALAFVRTAPKGQLFAETGYSDAVAMLAVGDYGTLEAEFITANLPGATAATEVKQDLVVVPSWANPAEMFFGYCTLNQDTAQGPLVSTFKTFSAGWIPGGQFKDFSIRSHPSYKDVTAVKAWSPDPWVSNGFLFKQGAEPKTAKLIYIEAGSFVSQDMSPIGFSVDQFATSEDGKMLYFSKNRDCLAEDAASPDPVVPADIAKGTTPYQIYASRCVQTDASGAKLLFYDPFPFVELGHPADQLWNCSIGGTSTFIYNSITDIENSAADLYFCSVPLFTCIALEDFKSEHTFVCKGETADFLVTVRNDGNVVISSFTIIITTDAGYYQEVKVTTAANNAVHGVQDIVSKSVLATRMAALTASGEDEQAFTAQSLKDDPSWFETLADNPEQLAALADPSTISKVVDGQLLELDAPTMANVLIPGKERTYRASLAIPDVWTQEQNLHVVIKDGSAQVSSEPGFSEHADVHATAIDASTFMDYETIHPSVAIAGLGTVGADVGVSTSSYSYAGESVTPSIPATADSNTATLLPVAAALAGAGITAAAVAKALSKEEPEVLE